MSNIVFILKHSGLQRFKIYIAVVCSMVSSLMTLAPYILAYEILKLLLNDQVNIADVEGLVIIAMVAAVVHIVFMFLSLAFSHIAAFSILYEIRMKTIEHMGKVPLGFFRRYSSGQIKKALDEDIEKLELFIAHQIPDLAESISMPLVVILYLMYLNWQMGLVLFIPLILSFLVQFFIYRGRMDMMRSYTNLLSKLHAIIVEYIHGINIFKAFNLTAKSFHTYSEVTTKYLEFWKRVTYETMPLYTVASILIDSGLLFTIPIGGILFLIGALEAPAYLIFLLLSSVFLDAFKKLQNLGMNLSLLLSGAEKVREILEVEKQQDQGIEKLEGTARSISYKNVHFAYTQRTVLKNINLEIPASSSVALVGASGSGKTTMGLLLGRFYDIQSGAIEIDGVNIKDIGIDTLMQMTAFVFQDVFMLNDTIENNIKMGMDVSDDDVVKAAKKAQIHDFILTLENGYKTIIGPGTGIKLSGGEKQRISIARVFLKDAPIIVLDEVTSYSDIDNETKIQEAMTELLKGRTVLIIAHRLYTIKDVDQIVVLDKGIIAECGTHEMLLNRKGRYYQLWNKGKGGLEIA